MLVTLQDPAKCPPTPRTESHPFVLNTQFVLIHCTALRGYLLQARPHAGRWGLWGRGGGAPLINSYPIRCQEYPSSSVPPDKSPSTCQATSRAPSRRSPPCRLRAELSPPCPGSAPSPCIGTLSRDRDRISLSSVTLAASQGLVQMTCPGRVWGMTKW